MSRKAPENNSFVKDFNDQQNSQIKRNNTYRVFSGEFGQEITR